jgi:hypothetical protein
MARKSVPRLPWLLADNGFYEFLGRGFQILIKFNLVEQELSESLTSSSR